VRLLAVREGRDLNGGVKSDCAGRRVTDSARRPSTTTTTKGNDMTTRTYGENTTPAILRCDFLDGCVDWKVSPFGPNDPDRDCYWVDTKAEAIEECEMLDEMIDYVNGDNGMERFTEQARAFDAFLGLIPRKLLPDMIGVGRPECSAAFSVWLVEYMDTNAYDELGNYPDLVKLAAYEKARRAL
jgi:hypothetical protein